MSLEAILVITFLALVYGSLILWTYIFEQSPRSLARIDAQKEQFRDTLRIHFDFNVGQYI